MCDEFYKSGVVRVMAAQALEDYGIDCFNAFTEKNPSAIPCRIRRKRTKGFKTPENTVYVGRGSKWGNPFVVGKDGTQEECVAKFRELIIYTAGFNGVEALLAKQPHPRIEIDTTSGGLSVIDCLKIDTLRGKNLSCWCKLDEKCHADVLLEIANSSFDGK
jgi:hypothetical protein